jgi:hypothetical protein
MFKTLSMRSDVGKPGYGGIRVAFPVRAGVYIGLGPGLAGALGSGMN